MLAHAAPAILRLLLWRRWLRLLLLALTTTHRGFMVDYYAPVLLPACERGVVFFFEASTARKDLAGVAQKRRPPGARVNGN